MNAIEIKHLSKYYKDKKAVDDLSINIEEGKLFALLGVNGAGKTTTIKMLSCLIKPTKGDATLLGHSILTDAMKVKEITNVSPQETAVAPNLTVTENLEFIAAIYGLNKQETTESINEMVETFTLQEVLNKKAKTLSGGWMRRLSIAMALITHPQILFLDEPTLGLDVIARHELWDKILNLKGKITIVLTTHYLEEVEALADEAGIMTEGKLITYGTIDQIKKEAGKESLEDSFIELIKRVK